MKKITILFCFAVLSFVASAQIELEHSFTTDYSHVYSFVYNSNEIMYYSIDTVNNIVKLYNNDFSLFKQVSIERKIGSNVYIEYPSQKLFNTNDLIEFICYIDMYDSNNGYSTGVIIYDENSTVIKDFGILKGEANVDIVGSNDESMLILSYNYRGTNNGTTDIYSLPGSILSYNSKKSNYKSAYPNPSNKTINLPYKLDIGESSMNIYNSDGQLVDRVKVDYTFDRIILNVSMYEKGVYLYECNGISNKFIVN